MVKRQYDKQRPHNVEAEEAVLGSILIDPDAIIRLSSFLLPEDFYIERHGFVYQAITDLNDNNVPIDLLLLCDKLESSKHLDEVGGGAFLTALMNNTPSSIHVLHYAHIVKRTSTLRKYIDAGTEIVQMAYKDDMNLEDLAEKADELLMEARPETIKGPRKIDELLDEEEVRQKYLMENGAALGLKTGIETVDKHLLKAGVMPTDFVVFAGRPGMGKSAMATTVAKNLSRQKKHVAMFSLEMSDDEQTRRLISADAHINTVALRVGINQDDDWLSFRDAKTRLSDAMIFIDDTAYISPSQLRAKSKRLHLEVGLDLIIVDYLQLMQGKGDNRTQEISNISRQLKLLAKELRVPVLALSQLSRQVESRSDKRPILSDLRDSGAIEQDSDIVVFLYRDEIYHPDTEFRNLCDVILAKYRHGPTGTHAVYFHKEFGDFVDLEVRKIPLEPLGQEEEIDF